MRSKLSLFLFCFLFSVLGEALKVEGNYKLETFTHKKKGIFPSHHGHFFLGHNFSDGLSVLLDLEIFNEEALTVLNPFERRAYFYLSSPLVIEKDFLSDIESSLYFRRALLTWDHEYGGLRIGRYPLDFGLGMVFKNPTSPFEYWSEKNENYTLSHEFHLGKFFVEPAIVLSKKDFHATGYWVKGSLGDKKESKRYALMYYEEKVKGRSLARTLESFSDQFERWRSGSPTPPLSSLSSHHPYGFTRTLMSAFFSYKTPSDYEVSCEGALSRSSKYSLITEKEEVQEVKNNGMAVSCDIHQETTFFLKQGKMGALLGFATGDSDQTKDKAENFSFHKNFKVSFLLNNFYPYDRLLGFPLDFSLSNVFFAKPYVSFEMKPDLDVEAALSFMKNPREVTLGNLMELDLSLLWKLNSFFSLRSEAGFMASTSGFKTWGIRSSLLLSF